MEGRSRERVCRSSSRSPSLSRRPSLKDKASGISKTKRKGSGRKKERWLLTRKTWRYMTDAVGSLLPDKPRSISPPSSRRQSSSLPSPVTLTPPPLPTPSTSATHSYGVAPAGHSYTSPSSHSQQQPQPWPLYQPPIYTDKRESIARSSTCSTGTTVTTTTTTTEQHEPSIASLEEKFAKSCKNEKKFLLWTRTKAPGLSGPALREYKEQQRQGQRTRNSSDSSSIAGKPTSPTEKTKNYLEYYSHDDEDLLDDYEDYEPDEEQMTVRAFFPVARKNSSGASSLISIVSGNLSFWKHHNPQPGEAISPTILKEVGTQTDPLPEYIISRLRRLETTGINTGIGSDDKNDGEICGTSSSELTRESRISSNTTSGDGYSARGSICDTGIILGSETDKKSEESGYSSSISDTVMRYLRMVRKNSKADAKDAIDRFKTVNYDRSLRDIKSKNVTMEDVLEHEKKKALLATSATSSTAPVTPQPTSTNVAHQLKSDTEKISAQKLEERLRTQRGVSRKNETKLTKSKKPNVLDDPSRPESSDEMCQNVKSPTDSASSPELFISPPVSPPPPPPSVGIQTGISLIGIFKSNSPTRKFSDISLYNSFDPQTIDGVFSDSSPRYSLTTTGSDSSDFVSTNPRSNTHSQWEHDKPYNDSFRISNISGDGRSHQIMYSPLSHPRKISGIQGDVSSGSSTSSKIPISTSTVSHPSTSSPIHIKKVVKRSGHIPSTKETVSASFVTTPSKTSALATTESSASVGKGGFAESITSFLSKHSPASVISSVTKSGSLVRLGSNKSTTGLQSSSSSSVMQKSKSSSNVFHGHGSGSSSNEKRGSTSSTSGFLGTSSNPSSNLSGPGSKLMSKSRIFKSRSKSTGRSTPVPCSWSPQGKCAWVSPSGKIITLESQPLNSLSDKELEALQQVALAKLQALNLGAEVKIPREKVVQCEKPKRRTYLLRKKALSTGLVDPGQDSSAIGGSGQVFRIPLSQCIQNDRVRERTRKSITDELKRSHNGTNKLHGITTCDPSIKDKLGSTEILSSSKRGSSSGLQDPITSTVGTRENIPQGEAVPTFITSTIKYLEKYGLNTVGIFRVTPNLRKMRQLREEIDSGKNFAFDDEQSPHEVAALLKEFLRDLPEPLLSRDLYKAFLSTQKMLNRQLQFEAVQHLIQLLPTPNRHTLAALLSFFAHVAENASDRLTRSGELLKGNKMESYNLATLIAPNILPFISSSSTTSISQVPQFPSTNETREREESIDVVNYLILNHDRLFEVSPEVLNSVYVHLMDTDPDLLESILKQKAVDDDPVLDDLETTSSVFEGSESGETWEGDDPVVSSRTKKLQRPDDGEKSLQLETKKEAGSRSRRDGSKDRSGNEADKHTSGGESDSNTSTKSSSRWFRRPRTDPKSRTTSDSGSDSSREQRKDSISLRSTKRASSLDSMNLKDSMTSTEGVPDNIEKERSSSDQNLKVPEPINRRQSSPVLERGVITASLRIPVPLNIDDNEIPYIEEENHEGHQRLILKHVHQDDQKPILTKITSGIVEPPMSPARPTQCYVNTRISTIPHETDVASPGSGTPPCESSAFPYEELTGRFLIGPPRTSVPTTGVSSTAVTTPAVIAKTKLHQLPTVGTTKLLEGPNLSTKTSKDSVSSVLPSSSASSLSEAKADEIDTKKSGLIKSKTADFEKFAKDHQSRTPTSPISSNLRLRSQGNIQLKQEFLLRQQQQQQHKSGGGPAKSSSGIIFPSMSSTQQASEVSGIKTKDATPSKVSTAPQAKQTPSQAAIKRSDIISSQTSQEQPQTSKQINPAKSGKTAFKQKHHWHS